MSRIHGGAIWWVVLWAWATTAAVVLAVGWTVAATLARRRPAPGRRATARTAANAFLASVLVVAVAAFTYQARHTDLDRPEESRSIGQITRQTISTLAGEDGGNGLDGRFQLRWQDDLLLSGLPYGLLLELERQGLDVGMPDRHGIPYRQRVPRRGDRFLDYVVGEADLDDWRARRDVVEVATYDDPYLGPMAMFLSDVTARDEVPDP
jgi:hypothetical protein